MIPELAAFPRAVADPLCPLGGPITTPLDRRLLWHIELVLSVGRPDHRETAAPLGRYLRATCVHHWHESLDYTDQTMWQCLWCHETTWTAPDGPVCEGDIGDAGPLSSVVLTPIVDRIGDAVIEHGERDTLDPGNPGACLCGVAHYMYCPSWLSGSGTVTGLRLGERP